MIVLRLIKFEGHEKKTICRILNGFQYLGQIDEDGRRAISRIKDGEGVSLDTIVRVQAVLGLYEEKLELESHLEASPDWVERNRQAQARGAVTIVLDPKLAVSMLRETRRHQLVELRELKTLIEEAQAKLCGLADPKTEDPDEQPKPIAVATARGWPAFGP